MKKTLSLLCLLAGIVAALAQPNAVSLPRQQMLRFTENKGQVADMEGNLRPDILFTAQSNGVKLFL
ncbi:MAG TPA: hypothetical protein PLW44_04585, partial [Chitinophagales bacterium]|nr:hypothetical protein [Chitinophagales bacterium]